MFTAIDENGDGVIQLSEVIRKKNVEENKEKEEKNASGSDEEDETETFIDYLVRVV